MDATATRGGGPLRRVVRAAARLPAAPRDISRRWLRRAVFGTLLAPALLLAAQGCGGVAAATTTSAGPTPAAARQIVQSYLAAEKVALTDHSEALASSLDAYSAYDLTLAAFHIAGYGRLPTYTYGQPTLYVPRLTAFPYWFLALVPQRPNGGGSGSTVVLAFDRFDAQATWELAGSATLDANAPPLNVATSGGYATAVTSPGKPALVSPDVVGAMQAAVVDNGPTSRAATVVASGPRTTGWFATELSREHQAAARGETYGWLMEGTSDPVFALRTRDGGAVVFYTMSLNTTTKVNPAAAGSRHPKGGPGAASSPSATSTAGQSGGSSPTIPLPTGAVRHLMPLHQHPIRHELDVDQTLQFLAIDPRGATGATATGHGPKIRIVAAGGGPTYAGGH